MDFKSHIPVVPNWPTPGVNFLDITGLLTDPLVFKQVTTFMIEICGQFQGTSIIALESRGFIFAAPVARELGLPLIIVRKPGKLPRSCHTIKYATEYSQDELSIHIDSPVGDRPIIVDDVIATGGTVLAVNQLLNEHFLVDQTLAASVIGLEFLPGLARLAEAGIKTQTLINYE